VRESGLVEQVLEGPRTLAYRGIAQALALQTTALICIAVSALAFASVFYAARIDGAPAVALLCTFFFAGFMVITVIWVRRAWNICYRATLTEDTLTFHQLGRTRRVWLEDVHEISTDRLRGESLLLLAFHLPTGRAIVEVSRGKAFAEAILSASPTPIEATGWEPAGA
jgi:hypothetical protein